MPEIYPDPHRAEIAETLSSLPLQNIEGSLVRPSDMILELEKPQIYGARSLTEEGIVRTGGSPRHWRILIPSNVVGHGLRSLEFGTSGHDIGGAGHQESVVAHEMFLDEVVDLNYEINPAVKKLFAAVGGIAVMAARNNGHRIFTALEVRYKPSEEDQTTLMWTHLFYSKALLNAHKYIPINTRRNNPRWLRQAAMPRHAVKTAEAISLGALAAHRESQRHR
jgi:hypothetical protein